MSRIFNFGAGPATLPLEVLEEVRDEFLDYPFDGKQMGMSIIEMSHRSKAYDAVNEQTEADMKELLGLGDDYQVLFMQGGATTQFSMVPLNFLKAGRTADYILTGTWSEKALAEAKKVGDTHVAASGKDSNYARLPQPKEIQLSENPVYIHLTTNNTIFGTQWRDIAPLNLNPGKHLLVADMSSDILSHPFKADDYGLIYAGAQKNIGPAGLTVVIMRRELAEDPDPTLPIMLQYKTFTKHKSLYNTPPVFAVYIMGKVLKWIKKNGGLAGMAAHNEAKAKLIYDIIDSHPDFYKGHATPDSRSLMNITFRLPNEELEAEFVKQAQAAGMSGLKGHRSVGGLRASIYNGMPKAGCEALARFMLEFMNNNA